MSFLDPHFKFRIGDLVTHVGMPDCESVEVEHTVKEIKTKQRWQRRAQRFVISERIAQECSGGIQLLYRIHALFGEGDEYGVRILKEWISEPMLKPYPIGGVT